MVEDGFWYRAIFASTCPTETELVNALTSSPSWFELTKALTSDG
jgi:hypothetical protein